jgi:hypothetical protein
MDVKYEYRKNGERWVYPLAEVSLPGCCGSLREAGFVSLPWKKRTQQGAPIVYLDAPEANSDKR